MFGWPCDQEIESLRDQFARETNPAKLKAIAEAVQVRETIYPTHLPLGQWYGAVAVLATSVLAVNMLGDGLRDMLDPRTRKQI